ncbi:MAG: hypothetical protein ACRDYC_08530 [Acidimicrobiales bacterium]
MTWTSVVYFVCFFIAWVGWINGIRRLLEADRRIEKAERELFAAKRTIWSLRLFRAWVEGRWVE